MRITKYNEDNWAGFNSKQHGKGEMLQAILLKRNLTDDCQNIVPKGLSDVRSCLK